MIVASPAKLNLFLHVVGRRPNGYHELQSVFVLIDWCDELRFDVTPSGPVSWVGHNEAARALPANNLVNRAAELLRQHTGCELGAHIGLTKHIPSEAGLGGGSGNAATVLLALNHLWGLHLPTQELAILGAQLGADVPFFVHGQDAWVEGIGERITPIALPQQRWWVIKPPTGASTPAIFGHPRLRRDTPRVSLHDFLSLPPVDQASFGTNDLQPPATAVCPAIGDALTWMRDHGLSPRMSGSGSAVFAPIPTRSPTPMPPLPTGWTGKICNKLDHHPFYNAISSL